MSPARTVSNKLILHSAWSKRGFYSSMIGLIGLGASIMVGGCDSNHDGVRAVSPPKAELQSLIARTAPLKVFFAHQSVGQNILGGLEELVNGAGTHLSIVDMNAQLGAWPKEPGLWHAKIGINTKPETKIDAFVEAFHTWAGDKPQVAMFKFCYVDVTDQTNVPELLDRYRAAMQRLKAEFPNTKFGHVTVPLAPSPDTVKAKIKRLVGKRVEEDASNLARTAYNRTLRGMFAGDPIFDLERVESTRVDGTRVQIPVNGSIAFGLASEYASDPWGHLNGLGSREAALELLRFAGGAIPNGSAAPERIH